MSRIRRWAGAANTLENIKSSHRVSASLFRSLILSSPTQPLQLSSSLWRSGGAEGQSPSMLLARRHFTPPRSRAWLTLLCVAVTTVSVCRGDEVLFQDDFRGKLGEGWSWRREHPRAWRVTERGLEVRIEPGNMWGPANNASNVLLRAAPDTAA